jgi:hypothetical protein
MLIIITTKRNLLCSRSVWEWRSKHAASGRQLLDNATRHLRDERVLANRTHAATRNIQWCITIRKSAVNCYLLWIIRFRQIQAHVQFMCCQRNNSRLHGGWTNFKPASPPHALRLYTAWQADLLCRPLLWNCIDVAVSSGAVPDCWELNNALW